MCLTLNLKFFFIDYFVCQGNDLLSLGIIMLEYALVNPPIYWKLDKKEIFTYSKENYFYLCHVTYNWRKIWKSL